MQHEKLPLKYRIQQPLVAAGAPDRVFQSARLARIGEDLRRALCLPPILHALGLGGAAGAALQTLELGEASRLPAASSAPHEAGPNGQLLSNA